MTLREEIFDYLRGELVDNHGVMPQEVTLTAELADDLNLDSLDTVELVLSVQERFTIDVSDAEIQDLDQVSDVIELVLRLVGAREAVGGG